MTVLTDHVTTVELPSTRSAIPSVTAGRFRRLGLTYAFFWAAGALPGFLGLSDGWVAAGLGLALPGGGFLYGGHPVWALGVIAAVAVSIFVWWALGPVVLPPLVWIGSAVASGLMVGQVHGWAAPLALCTIPAIAACVYIVHRVRYAAQVRRGAELNERLREVEFVITGPPGDDVRVPVAEHSEEDLAHLRYALDLALQPMDRFDGFTRIDQFREAATRYQLNALGYSLSMSQFTRTPAFTGYLAVAQRNAIEKMLDRRVWGYWALENAWGNLRFGRDPIANSDNIMLTGFYGVMVAMYESLNDDRYSRPGALTFQWDDATAFVHDYPGLATAVHRSMTAAPFTLYPCEPNWIYTVCNTFGMNTLLSHDRLHGSGLFPDLEARLRDSYEHEFLRPDGRIIGVRSENYGMSWNFWSGSAVQLTTAYWLHAALPDIAQRTWWIIRETLARRPDGSAVLPRSLANRVDPGNYRLGTEVYGMAATLMAAREMGDEEWAEAAVQSLERHAESSPTTGARRYAGGSALANLWANLGRFGRHSAVRDLLVFGPPEAWRRGPVLAEADYPDVLVARAVTDGSRLDLVLRPGNGPVRARLGLGGLVPDRTYDLRGAVEPTVVASSDGTAKFHVELGGRHEIAVSPR
ncbi:MAG TPA: hypothetical protein VJ782_08845 [Aeromicrobium sp.]|nr:hypothetical protein [Aeromicrobium sp.]